MQITWSVFNSLSNSSTLVIFFRIMVWRNGRMAFHASSSSSASSHRSSSPFHCKKPSAPCVDIHRRKIMGMVASFLSTKLRPRSKKIRKNHRTLNDLTATKGSCKKGSYDTLVSVNILSLATAFSGLHRLTNWAGGFLGANDDSSQVI